MKKVNSILLILAGLLIISGEFLRSQVKYELVGKLFSILALGIVISAALLNNKKSKKSYIIIILLVALLFLLYPVFF